MEITLHKSEKFVESSIKEKILQNFYQIWKRRIHKKIIWYILCGNIKKNQGKCHECLIKSHY